MPVPAHPLRLSTAAGLVLTLMLAICGGDIAAAATTDDPAPQAPATTAAAVAVTATATAAAPVDRGDGSASAAANATAAAPVDRGDGSASAAANATAAAPTMTLAEGIREALRANRDLIASADNLAAAVANRKIAGDLINPTLSLSTARIDLNRPHQSGPVLQRSYDTIIGLTELIEMGGKRGDRVAAATAGERAAQASQADGRRVVRLAVAQGWVAHALARATERIVLESADALDREASIARERLRQGDLASADAEQIEVAAEQRRVDADTAVHDETAARIALSVLLGRDPDRVWTTAEDLADLAAPASIDHLPATPPERPDVLAAEEQVRSFAASYRLSRAGRLPDPTVGLAYEHNPPGDGSGGGDSLGVSLSIPLPVLDQNQDQIESAWVAWRAAGHALERARATAASDLANARLDQQAAAAKAARYNDEILPRAQHAWEAVSFSYHAGAASLVDLLEAQRTLNDVRLAAAQSQADALAAGFALRSLSLPEDAAP